MDGRAAAHNDSPEQLLDVFKAAALSVTRLYKSSVAAETRARSEGYQECLEDLIAFLDRDAQALGQGGLSKLRRWIAERRDGGDTSPQNFESEDEVDKPEAPSQPEPAQIEPPTPPVNEPVSQPANESGSMVEDEPRPPEFLVPTQENFTFQSDHQYPNIDLLDLSDTRPHTHHSSRQSRNRPGKPGMRTSGPLGRGAGTKRRMDLDDLFGGCFGGKDPFGGGGKRSRHS